MNRPILSYQQQALSFEFHLLVLLESRSDHAITDKAKITITRPLLPSKSWEGNFMMSKPNYEVLKKSLLSINDARMTLKVYYMKCRCGAIAC